MKKVIVKCKLKNHETFERKLSDIDLDFSAVQWQHDRIYVPREYKKNSNYPRLIMRTTMQAVDKPARYSFILKRHIEDSGVDIVEETVVKDYETVVKIILQLGFKLAAEVSRRRQYLSMGEGVYIYLDKIEKLPGYYAKIEAALPEGESVSAVREDIAKTFQALGESSFVDSTYFELNHN